MSVPPKRFPITTHVLDQNSGTPAAGIKAELHLQSYTGVEVAGMERHYVASTDSQSGRVEAWSKLSSGSLELYECFEKMKKSGRTETAVWRLSLHVKDYWKSRGVDSFYPVVEVVFETELKKEGREHWHVPVLLGPFGYTTYRGT